MAGWYADVFGPDGYFMEIQAHGLSDQVRATEGAIRIARALGVAIAGTNDSHYLEAGDARAHETPADDGYVDHGSPGINPSGVYRAVPEMTTAAAKALARGVMAGGSDLAGRRRGATMKR